MIALPLDDRTTLLRIARDGVEAGIRSVPPPDIGAVSERLREPGGAFVTLHLDGDLRGCVGYVEPTNPLAETVGRAGGAVTRDSRFPPLALLELPSVNVEVSVLSRLVPIDPEDVEVGVHGLVLMCRGRSGLLLPQVPVEQVWDRTTFLDHLCLKAGLPVGSWRRGDAELLAFTSLRFAER